MTELRFSDKIISIEDFERRWKSNIRPGVIYLHNPFCKTRDNCLYCRHAGCPRSDHTAQEVEDFYFRYMPLLFSHYKNIIDGMDLRLADFGGGTPDYLPAGAFDIYCGSLPDKIKKARKIIELHPALVTEDFVDVLRRYGFTTAVFCFQTFDERILKENGRLVPDYRNAFRCMKKAQEHGINIAVDFITYWTTEPGWDDVLRSDFRKLKGGCESAGCGLPDEITVSVLYQNKYNRDDFNGYDVYKRIKAAIAEHFPDYENPEGTLDSNFEVAATRIYRSGSDVRKDFDVYLDSLSDLPWEHEQGYSTLGMGTYKNRDKSAYSMIGPDFLAYEKFMGFDRPPEIHVHRDYNFWQAARNVIDYLEKTYGENPPVGADLILRNISDFTNVREEQFAQVFQGNCRWALKPRRTFSGKSDFEMRLEDEFFGRAVDKEAAARYNTAIKEQK